MPSAGLDGLISKHGGGVGGWGGAAREQIGQPDYSGPAPFTGPLGSEHLFRRRGEDIQSPCITSLCFHLTLSGSVWGDGGGGWGGGVSAKRETTALITCAALCSAKAQ